MVQYTPSEINTQQPFFGTGWPVRKPAKGSVNYDGITERSEYRGEQRLWLACTQLGVGYTAADQKRILREWRQFFGESPPVRELALRSRVPVELFESVCQHQPLQRLHVKWGPVSDLAPLANLQQLEGLSLGTSSIEDISPLAKLPKLKYLQFENPKRVQDFSALAGIKSLEFLQLCGDWAAPRKIHVKNIQFVRPLTKLRALSLDFVIVDDFDIAPLLGLKRLEYLLLPKISESDRQRLLKALPKLRYGNVAQPDSE